VEKLDGLEYIPEVYPKDLGYAVNELIEAVNELIDKVEHLEKTLARKETNAT